MYKIKQVDNSKLEVRTSLMKLHDATFGDTAPTPDFGKGFWWIAYLDGEEVGFAGMRQSRWYTDAGYMWRVGVLEEHQGHGLQKRFLRVRERLGRKLGYVGFVTDTRYNTPSMNNLIRAGYMAFEPKHPWSPLSDVIYWQKGAHVYKQ